jgi:hypothetical protein
MLVLAALALAGTAAAVRDIDRVELRAGDLIIVGRGGFRPEALPKHHDAPISIYGGGKLSTVSGELPPILDTLTFEFDRHGSVDTTGLAVCTAGKLQATDVPAARRACPNAIVEGFGTATVKFPEGAPIPVSSPITLFNGPKKHGEDTVLAHFYTTVPVATAFIVLVVIERIHRGVYGYRTEAKIPKIAGGYGHPISGRIKIGRKWTFKARSTATSMPAAKPVTCRRAVNSPSKTAPSSPAPFFRPCTVRK